MKCNKCGQTNSKEKIFCEKCGERLVAAPNDVSVNSEDSTQSKDNKKPNNYENKINKESPISRAWQDIKGTKGWFGKTMLIGLINCVPILNFAATGYAQQYGVAAKTSTKTNMPNDYITNKTFCSGFFEFITWLVYLIIWFVASSIVGAILGIVPIIGALIGLALAIAYIFWESIVSMASMRTAYKNELGKAFSVKEMAFSYKKGWGSLFACYFIPSIICKLISIAIGLVIIMVCAGALLPILSSAFSSALSAAYTHDWISWLYSFAPYIIQYIGSMVVVVVIVCVIASIISGFEKIFRYRAVGIWMTENCVDIDNLSK